MFSALTPDQPVPQDYPIRRIKPIVDRALKELSPTFRMYADICYLLTNYPMGKRKCRKSDIPMFVQG